MDITMVGIDYTDAGLDIRGKFSYTKREQEKTITALRKKEGISGCILLSTCNRTELVLSGQGNGSGRKGLFSVN